MAEWFECKVTYEKNDEDGKSIKVSECYLVDAVSFTDAEYIITNEVAKFIDGEFDIKAVKKEKLYEIVRDTNNGTWFKVGLAFIQLDEVTGKEKRNNVVIYMQSDDIFNLPKKLKEHLSDSMTDYVVTLIKETKIVEIFESKA